MNQRKFLEAGKCDRRPQHPAGGTESTVRWARCACQPTCSSQSRRNSAFRIPNSIGRLCVINAAVRSCLPRSASRHAMLATRTEAERRFRTRPTQSSRCAVDSRRMLSCTLPTLRNIFSLVCFFRGRQVWGWRAERWRSGRAVPRFQRLAFLCVRIPGRRSHRSLCPGLSCGALSALGAGSLELATGKSPLPADRIVDATERLWPRVLLCG